MVFVYFKVSFNWLHGHSLLPPGSPVEPECGPADPWLKPHIWQLFPNHTFTSFSCSLLIAALILNTRGCPWFSVRPHKEQKSLSFQHFLIIAARSVFVGVSTRICPAVLSTQCTSSLHGLKKNPPNLVSKGTRQAGQIWPRVLPARPLLPSELPQHCSRT